MTNILLDLKIIVQNRLSTPDLIGGKTDLIEAEEKINFAISITNSRPSISTDAGGLLLSYIRWKLARTIGNCSDDDLELPALQRLLFEIMDAFELSDLSKFLSNLV